MQSDAKPAAYAIHCNLRNGRNDTVLAGNRKASKKGRFV